VGKVDAFSIDGLDLWFNTSDHLPPHIHVKRAGEWEIRVYFLLCGDGRLEFDQKWGQRVPAAFRARILESVLEHRVSLLMEWEKKVCRSI
jgi:tartrate dehydratase alpha subunit/fumarate hydratase class I-like protein